jgi:outer membrane lipoprotein LolB
MMIVKRAVFGLLAISLVGCSTVPEKPVQEYMLAGMQHLQQQHNWRFEGRLAMVDERDSISASISWRHRPESDEIELSGPLAQGRVLVYVTADSVVIDSGDGRQVYPGRADEVMAEQLGVDMPVNALRYWVLGVNHPELAYVERTGGFSQNGWLVLFREMQRVNDEWLPKKVTAEKNKTKIKLIVDQWDLS